MADLPRPSTALLSMSLRDDATTAAGTESKGRVSNHTGWIPQTLAYGGFSMSSGPRVLLRVSERPTSSPWSPCNESYFYLAADLMQARDKDLAELYELRPDGTVVPRDSEEEV